MEEVIGFSDYKQYKESLDKELNRAAESFVMIGYLLKVARDTNILYESGYTTVTQFAEAEYNIRPDQVTRFIQINDRYSEGGYGTSLQDNYKGMGYTKLVEMLQLPLPIAQELTPDFTREEIKEIRSEVEEENKITDLEVMMEQKDWDGEIPILKQVVIQLGHDNQEWYQKVHEWKNQGEGSQEFKWLMDPSGSTVYSIRIRGLGKYLLSVKEKEEQIVLINVRTGEKETADWGTVMKMASDLIELGTWKESWQQVYGETIEEEEAPVPVNTGSGANQAKKKEKKVVVVKKQEKKGSQKSDRTTGKSDRTTEKSDKNTEKRDQRTEKSDQNLEKEHRNETEEHGPDIERTGTEQDEKPEEKQVGENGKTAGIAPEQSQEKPIGTRKQFLDGLTEYGAAEEIASHIRKVIETAERQDLEKYSHWEKWLSEDVDSIGNTWEYEEDQDE